MRIGHGYDVHKLVECRNLILGGVNVPFHLGLLGHSDADVLLHAICDALLGAAALGDIGKHFPDTSDEFAGIDSKILLGRVMSIVRSEGWSVANVDITIAMQKPKLAPYNRTMRESLANALGVSLDRVSVKAKTNEGMGFVGRLEGLEARAVVLLSRN